MKKSMKETRRLTTGHHDPCVHVSREGSRVPKICLRKHECWHCAFDQWIEAVEDAVVDGCDLTKKQNLLLRAA